MAQTPRAAPATVRKKAAAPGTNAAAAPAPKVPRSAAKQKPAARPVSAPAPVDPAALKLVRDGFTMPRQDFDLIATLKKRAVTLHRPAKKSELLRAGLHALQRLPDTALLASLEALVPVKLGRPKKGG